MSNWHKHTRRRLLQRPPVKGRFAICCRAFSALLLLFCCLSFPLFADTLRLDIQGIDGELLNNVRAHLALAKFKADESLSATRIKRLFKHAEQQTRLALQPLGYYRPEIKAELIEPADTQKAWQVLIQVNAKDAIRLHRVHLEILGEAQQDAEFNALMQKLPLQLGAVLRHDLYEQSKKGLRDLAEMRGYFDAHWLQSRIEINPDTYQATAFLQFEAGTRYRFGTLHFQQERFAEGFLQAFLPFHSGDFYHNEKLLDLQARLSNSDYFDNIEIIPQRRHTAEGAWVDLDIRLTPKTQRAYRGRLGYGTDTGLRVALDMQWRYLNRYGHRLLPNIGWSQNRNRYLADVRYLIPTSDDQADYLETTLAYRAEDFKSSDISLSDNAASGTGVNGSTRVVDLSLALNKYQPRLFFGQRLDELWSLSYLTESYELLPLLFSQTEQAFLAQLENSQAESLNLAPLRPNYALLYAGVSWLYQHSDDPIYTLNGEQLKFSLKGAVKGAGSNVSFWQARLESHLIRRLHERGRLIMRSDFAYTKAETLSVLDNLFQSNDLPKALQFRTGGDRSVRGYSFEEIDGGAQTLVSGKHLVTASLEYEYRLFDEWSLGVFYDAGNVFNNFDKVRLKQGTGVGVRWHSPVGLVRLDLGYALDKSQGRWRIHLNVGPDF